MRDNPTKNYNRVNRYHSFAELRLSHPHNSEVPLLDRFFHCPLEGQLGDLVTLSDEEGHHISRVLRKSSGDPIELFDGLGRSAPALLVDVRKKSVTAELSGPVAEDPSRPKQLLLAVAAPKADRFKWLVEKVTELGVAELIPLECEHSVVHPGDGKLEKLRAQVIAACKQSGRNRLMTIQEPMPFEAALDLVADRKWIADVPSAVTKGSDSSEVSDNETTTLVLVGPEGGWSDRERTLAAERGFQPLQVGSHILRIETAAIAAAACLVR